MRKRSLLFIISFSFISLVLTALITSIIIFVMLFKNNKLDDNLSNTKLPLISTALDFKNSLLYSKKLTYTYISNPTIENKNEFSDFLENKSIMIGKIIKEQSINEKNDFKTREQLKNLLLKYDYILKYENKIFILLNTNNGLKNDSLIDAAKDININIVKPSIKELDGLIDNFIANNQREINLIQSEKANSNIIVIATIFISIVLIILIGIFSLKYIKRNISQPIDHLKNIIQKLGMGEVINENIAIDQKASEIISMTESIVSLNIGLKSKIEFSNQIEKNNFEIDLQKISDKDIMSDSLLKMRDSLKMNVEAEEIRSWSSKGITQGLEILRKIDVDESVIFDEILKFTINYIDANQGGLFLYNDNCLKLESCYAYDRKKFLNKEIQIGEGLIGQCYLEKQKIIIKKVPEDYANISSGLGEATPSFVIIIPLITNDVVEGILEIASFETLENYKIEFLNLICENLSLNITSAKGIEKVKTLLVNSQQQTEEMRAQEEEMRQNLEELSATQDEMAIKEQMLQKNLEEMKIQEEEMRQNLEELNAIKDEMIIKEQRLQENLEEMRAQEEEMRQNMEELTATQEELELRSHEVEQVRQIEKERLDAQLGSQKKIMEQFVIKSKEKEKSLLDEIKELKTQITEN